MTGTGEHSRSELRVWKGSLINALPDCCRRQSNNHVEINVQAHSNKQWLTATSSSKSRHLTSAGGCETVAESWCDQRDNVVPSHTTEAVNCIPWLCGWDDMNIWWPEVSRASNIFNLRFGGQDDKCSAKWGGTIKTIKLVFPQTCLKGTAAGLHLTSDFNMARAWDSS